MAIILLAGIHQSENRAWIKNLVLGSGVILFIIQIFTLSKGPIVALILCLILALILFRKKRVFLNSALLILTALILIVSIIHLFNLDTRFYMNPFRDVWDNTYRIRYTLFLRAWTDFISHPAAGIGFGNYLQFASDGYFHHYPHNLFFEFLAETGLIGVSLLCFILFQYVKQVYQFVLRNSGENRNHYQILFILLTLFMFLNQMVSGDTLSGRFFWFFLPVSSFCLGGWPRQND